MKWPWRKSQRPAVELSVLEERADQAIARTQRIRDEQARLILALRRTARALEGK